MDFNGTEIKRTGVVYNNLLKKLHPNRITGASDKMYYIISSIIGADWVTSDRGLGSFSVTSDGFVIDCGLFLGSYDDFKRNVRGYIAVAELTEKELAYFWTLYDMRVHDFRL